jgi:GGDEF domain-containing protein
MRWPLPFRGRTARAAAADDGALLTALLAERLADIDRLAGEVDGLRLENRRLSEAILVDPQTGLPNLAAFEADHAQLDARRRRTEDGYAVIPADVDHLAGYHEQFGAEAARVALEAVAGAVSATVRQSDRTYRYGLEEVAVLLPAAQLREAVTAAQGCGPGSSVWASSTRPIPPGS